MAYSFYRPSPIFCTDNAAMIGVAAYYEYIERNTPWMGSECSSESETGRTLKMAVKNIQPLFWQQDREKECTAKYRNSFWKYRDIRSCIIPCTVFRKAR